MGDVGRGPSTERAGDPAAQAASAVNAFVTRVIHAAESIATRVYGLGEADAQEVAQDVGLKVWAQLRSRPTVADLSPERVAGRTIRDVLIDRDRVSARRQSYEGIYARQAVVRETPAWARPDAALDEFDPASVSPRFAPLGPVLKALPAPSREALFLHYHDGMKAVEIARLTGETADTVRMRIHRALTALRKALSPAENQS